MFQSIPVKIGHMFTNQPVYPNKITQTTPLQNSTSSNFHLIRFLSRSRASLRQIISFRFRKLNPGDRFRFEGPLPASSKRVSRPSTSRNVVPVQVPAMTAGRGCAPRDALAVSAASPEGRQSTLRRSSIRKRRDIWPHRARDHYSRHFSFIGTHSIFLWSVFGGVDIF